MKFSLSRYKVFILSFLTVVCNVAIAVCCSFLGACFAILYFNYYGF